MQEISVLAPTFLQPNMKNDLKISFDIYPLLIVSMHYSVEVDIGFMGQKKISVLKLNLDLHYKMKIPKYKHEILSDRQIP